MRSLVVVVFAVLCGCQQGDVSREIGARCDSRDECDERCLGDDAGWPGGFCTVTCGAPDECAGDTTCADLEGGVCLFTCERDDDCEFLGKRWRCEDADLRGGGIKVMVCRG